MALDAERFVLIAGKAERRPLRDRVRDEMENERGQCGD